MYNSCITFFHQPEERGFPSTIPFRNFRPDSIHWTIMRRSYRTRNRIVIISECQFIHGRGSVVRPLPSGGHRKSSTARGGQRVVAPMAESGRSSSLSKHFANALWLSDNRYAEQYHLRTIKMCTTVSCNGMKQLCGRESLFFAFLRKQIPVEWEA